MNIIQYKTALIVAILSQFAAYALVACGVKELWYVFNAVTHVILWLTLLVSIRKTNIYKSDVWSNNLTLYGFVLAGNQLYDEIFGDPKKFQVNEGAVLVFILGHFLFQKRKIKRKKN